MKLAFLGTGLMGKPMAERLLTAGHQVNVYNRTTNRALDLTNAGAIIAASSSAALEHSEAAILMLTNAAAITELLFNDDAQFFLANRTIIQMSTIAPSESQAIAQRVIDAGGHYLEAPVLGSIGEAKNGTLLVMTGATEEQFQQWLPILKCLGTEPLRIGAVGQAAALKLALNQLIASLTASFCLSLGYIQSNGVDVELFMQILRQSALYAPTFDKKLARYLDRDYRNPNFPTKHLAKDVRLLLSETASSSLNTAMLSSVERLLSEALASDLGDQDYAAIFEMIYPKVK